MKFKKIALLAMSTLALAACGGGGDVKVSSGVPSIDAAPHIKGTLLGAAFNAQTSVNGHEHGGTTLFIWGSVTTGETVQADWYIYGLPKTKGTYACGTALSETSGILQINLVDYRNEPANYYSANGAFGSSCSITVVDVSATEVSGTFVATLTQEAEGDPTSQVTMGSFRVPLNDFDLPV